MTLSTPTSGHALGLPTVTRRALLGASGALAVATLDVSPAMASAETPIQRLFRAWEQAMEEASAPGLSDEEGEALDVARYAVQDAIAAEPATDLRDLAIKVLVSSGEGCFGLADALTLECASLAGRDFAKMPGCLFEGARAGAGA